MYILIHKHVKSVERSLFQSFLVEDTKFAKCRQSRLLVRSLIVQNPSLHAHR